MISLHHQTKELFVSGDTYEHRALLKHLHFKWAPNTKVWHRLVNEMETMNFVLKMLEVNGVHFVADATVVFDPIDEEVMRSIAQSLLRR